MKKLQNFAFIDGQNFYLSTKSAGWNIHYTRFRKFLSDKYHVSKALYFIGEDKNQEIVYDALRKAGFEIVFKKMVIYKKRVNDKLQTFKKGNIDSDLIMRVVREVEQNNFDSAILISGDGDFLPLLDWLEEKEKLFKIGIPNIKDKSHLLDKYQKYFFFLEYLKDKIAYTRKRT
jgi:uncharacterized LabA/DUF88 family protein